MAEKNPNKLYDRIKTIKGSLESIESTVESIQGEVKELLADSDSFGGVISKVFKEQLAKYFIPGLTKMVEPIQGLKDGDRVPGSLKDLVIFLDSVPLAMVREEPSVAELAAPAVPENADIDVPVGDTKVTNEVDEVPLNASYNKGVGNPSEEIPVEEVGEEEEPRDLPEKNERVPFGKRLREGQRSFSRRPFRESKKIREFIDFSKDEDQETWRKSPKGKMEGTWWRDHCHSETENIFDRLDKIDAKRSLEKLGKIYVDEYTGRPIDPNYAKSLLRTWGEPKGKKEVLEESSDKKEKKDENIEIYKVVRSYKVGAPIGEDVAKLEDLIICDCDTKEEADEKAEELNLTVTPEEKSLLGTEYKVNKVKISPETLV